MTRERGLVEGGVVFPTWCLFPMGSICALMLNVWGEASAGRVQCQWLTVTLPGQSHNGESDVDCLMLPRAFGSIRDRLDEGVGAHSG